MQQHQHVILHSPGSHHIHITFSTTHPGIPRISSQPTHPHRATVQLFTRGYEVTNHSSLPFDYSREPRSKCERVVGGRPTMQYHLLVMVLAGTLMLLLRVLRVLLLNLAHTSLTCSCFLYILFTLVIFMKVDNISSHC